MPIVHECAGCAVPRRNGLGKANVECLDVTLTRTPTADQTEINLRTRPCVSTVPPTLSWTKVKTCTGTGIFKKCTETITFEPNP
jgi:hypothetical protein